MSFINWDYVAKRLVPTGKRFAWHLDWLNSQIKGLKDVHDQFRVVADELDVVTDYNDSVIMLRKRLNDIFDPYHIGISFTQNNFGAGPASFIVQVPDYLQYGDIEERMTAIIDYYLWYGTAYTYNYFAATATWASLYLDALAGTPTNTEIWSVINFYNKIRGHGLTAGLDRIHLISRSSLANAKIDFVTPATLLVEAGAGAIDFDNYGVASDGTRYFTTNLNPAVAGYDAYNSATLVYISQKGSGVDMSEYGAIDGTPEYNTFGIANNGTDMVSTQGALVDQIKAQIQEAGAFLTYSVARKLRTKRNNVVIGNEITNMTGPALPSQIEFLCAESQAGTPAKHSTNKIGTWIRYKGALSLSQQAALTNAVIEYNNLNSR